MAPRAGITEEGKTAFRHRFRDNAARIMQRRGKPFQSSAAIWAGSHPARGAEARAVQANRKAAAAYAGIDGNKRTAMVK